MEKSNPWRTWLLDVLKGILVFSIGATITVFGLNEIEARRELRQFQLRANWEHDLNVAEEYRKASLAYVQTTMGALAEVSKGAPDVTSLEWQRAENTRFLLALEAVKIRFGKRSSDVPALVQQLEQLHHAIYEEYRLIRSNPQKPGYYVFSDTFIQMQQLRFQLATELDRLMRTA